MQVPGTCEAEIEFLTNFTKNWKVCHFTVNGHRSFKLSGKVTFLRWLSEIGTLLRKLVLEIGTLVLFSSALGWPI